MHSRGVWSLGVHNVAGALDSWTVQPNRGHGSEGFYWPGRSFPGRGVLF